ncbi:class I mannose-6-phosphate isomerase [Fulvivirga maritima]|uniref:type I phosphomannose isomerase catalytic subunit n=1 Tax=Fulvivirga maritima TaxID=2904247 RepID=UPI001F2175BA|nr:type I phosphomannose isomerase catalytic subunit [Fulvivirga maritima]UII25608.1 class I mannose-6-phosphate isomerase [Fulvivirga maritima]
MSEQLYPLKFKTIFKDKIWGGTKIKDVLHKDYSPLPNCGETWELSGVEGNVSFVANGRLEGEPLTTLIANYKDKLVGKKVYETYGGQFPLLIKFIDANDDLSIQVHPDDKLAKERHNSFGKTEMWYIIQADEDATLITGFNQEVDKEAYLEYFNSGKLTDILNKEKVAEDDVFFIPAGRVHTIGKGIMLAEIQQSSDVTYRIYDFDRTDDKGNKRELHVEEAVDAIDYKFYDEYKSNKPVELNKNTALVECPFFETNRMVIDDEMKKDYSSLDSFVILVFLEGETTITAGDFKMQATLGDVVLIPAEVNDIVLTPLAKSKVLETYIPNF